MDGVLYACMSAVCDRQYQPDDSVTNRVAGFICKYIFSEHQSTVTSLVVVSREETETGTYLVHSYSYIVIHGVTGELVSVVNSIKN